MAPRARRSYRDLIANASEFFGRIAEGMALARELLPEAKLAVPYGYRFCQGPQTMYDEWNSVLAEHAHMFDAVTIHEYTACIHSVDNSGNYVAEQMESAVAAWGEAALSLHAANMRRIFSAADVDRLEVWLTEWSATSWQVAALPMSPLHFCGCLSSFT